MKKSAVNYGTSLYDKYTFQVKTCFFNLILLVVLSVINVVSIMLKFGYQFWFSAYLPSMLTWTGYFFGGTFDEKYKLLSMDYKIFYGFAFIAFLVIVPYIVSLIIYKKHTKGAIITSLVNFSIDCIVLIFYFDIGQMINVAFHIWVMFYLVSGFNAVKKLSDFEKDIAEAQKELESTENNIIQDDENETK